MNKIKIEKIEFEHLSLAYSPNAVVIPNITMDLELGHVYWLRGENGSGKSLLLKTMAGLYDPPVGQYKINDRNVSEMSFEEFLPYRLNIGFGFEMGGLLSNKTIFENVILPLEYHNLYSEKDAEKTIELLKRFDISRYKDVRPALVSGAVRRLACIIRAYVLEPELILLDDATSGLSDLQVIRLKEWINEYHLKFKKSTLIVSTQDNHFMKDFCDFDIYLERDSGFNLLKTKRVA